MITYSMTYKEMYDHWAKDLEKVEYRKQYFLPKAIKEFRKARKFPVWKWYEYTVPKTNNKYIIFYYADNPGSVENPKSDFFVDLFFDNERYIVKWGVGNFRYNSNNAMSIIPQINVYTSHFIHRYNERFLKDDTLSANDIACCYFIRNDIAIPIDLNDAINKNFTEYDEFGKHGMRVKDGFCGVIMGFESASYDENNCDWDRVDASVVIYKTFLSASILSDDQKISIDLEVEKKLKANYEEYIKESKNGFSSLTLEK